MSTETDKVWFVRKFKFWPDKLCPPTQVDLPERMTQIEAVHAASVLNERDRGRGVTWVAVEAGK